MKKVFILFLLTPMLLLSTACTGKAGVEGAPVNESPVLIMAYPDGAGSTPTPQPSASSEIQHTEEYKFYPYGDIQISHSGDYVAFVTGAYSDLRSNYLVLADSFSVSGTKLLRNYGEDQILASGTDSFITKGLESSDYCIGLSYPMWSHDDSKLVFVAEYAYANSRVYMYDVASDVVVNTNIELHREEDFMLPSFTLLNKNYDARPYVWSADGTRLIMTGRACANSTTSAAVEYYDSIITYCLDENGGYVELINNNTGFYGRCVDSVFIDGELMYVVRGPVLDSFSDYAQQEGIYLVNGNGRSQLCVTHDMIAELTTQNTVFVGEDGRAYYMVYEIDADEVSISLNCYDFRDGQERVLQQKNVGSIQSGDFVDCSIFLSEDREKVLFISDTAVIYDIARGRFLELEYAVDADNEAVVYAEWSADGSCVALQCINQNGSEEEYYVFHMDGEEISQDSVGQILLAGNFGLFDLYFEKDE